MVPAAAGTGRRGCGAERAPSGDEATRTDAATARCDTARERRAVCPAGAGGRGTRVRRGARALRVRRAGGGRRDGGGGAAEAYARVARRPRRRLGASRTFGYPASYAPYASYAPSGGDGPSAVAPREPEPAYDHAVDPGGLGAYGGAAERGAAARVAGGVGSFPGSFPGCRLPESAAIAHAHGRRRRRRRRRRSRSRRS